MANFDDLYPGKQNFCRVFELPDNYPGGFCHSGGKPVIMVMVDWFNPWPNSLIVSKDNLPDDWKDCSDLLRTFLKDKQYIKPGKKYVLITEFGESMVL